MARAMCGGYAQFKSCAVGLSRTFSGAATAAAWCGVEMTRIRRAGRVYAEAIYGVSTSKADQEAAVEAARIASLEASQRLKSGVERLDCDQIRAQFTNIEIILRVR